MNKLIKANKKDINIVRKYLYNNLITYLKDISNEELNNYINEIISTKYKYIRLIYEKEVCGLILYYDYMGGLFIDELYIEENYRNKGIATYIIDNLKNDSSNIYLYVFKENTKAIKLYKRLGFNIEEETKTRLLMRY